MCRLPAIGRSFIRIRAMIRIAYWLRTPAQDLLSIPCMLTSFCLEESENIVIAGDKKSTRRKACAFINLVETASSLTNGFWHDEFCGAFCIDADEFSFAAFVLKFYKALDQREKR